MFLHIFAEFELLMIHNNFVRISETKMNKRNCWTYASKLPILQISV